MGLGLFGGGVGAARYFAERGHDVLVTDLADADRLATSLAALADLPGIRYRLGGHEAGQILDADLVVASPAVPPTAALLRERRARGGAITSEIEVLLRELRAPVVAVTGSNGKTTTTSLLGRLFAERGLAHRVGGNIGGSLLPEVDTIGEDTTVILELSSFQLETLVLDRRPLLGAIITNVSPNHLDRHGDLASYRAAKLRLLGFMAEEAPLVFDGDDEGCAGLDAEARRHRLRPLPVGDAELEGVPRPARLVGRFNHRNLALATTLADAILGPDPAALGRCAAGFRGLAHRLEVLGELGSLVVINDSKATTPFATAAAVAALDRPIRLIAGGYDKGIAPDALLDAFARCERVVLFGATATALAAAWQLRPEARTRPALMAASLEEAIDLAAATPEGEAYLLFSPGHPSYDHFANFERRGEAFAALLRARPGFSPAVLTTPPALG